MANFQLNDRILTCDDREIECPGSDDLDGICLSDTFFMFLDEGLFECSSDHSFDHNNAYSDDHVNDVNEEEKDDDDDDEEAEEQQNIVKIPDYYKLWAPIMHKPIMVSWAASKYSAVLEEIEIPRYHRFCAISDQEYGKRTTYLESTKYVRSWKEMLKEMERPRVLRRPDPFLSYRRLLHNFDSTICKSKSRYSPKNLPGEHTFLEVPNISDSRKIEMRVIIKYNIRGEFETIKASGDYDPLLKRIPEVDIENIENLLSVTKVLCLAANKRMMEKRMQIGASRNHRYTQAQWHKTSKRKTSSSFGRRNV